MSAWTTEDTPKTNQPSSEMQHPDPVNSNETHDKPDAAPSANGSSLTDPTIFHNPSNLTAEQVGDGYRLLTTAEFKNIADPESVTELWHRVDNDWDTRSTPWSSLSDANTYRVPIATELGVGARVRIIGTPWGLPKFTRRLGRVGRVESIDRGHDARYLVADAGSGVSVWYEEGAVDRDYSDGTAPESAEPAEHAPSTFRFKEGDRVVVTGPTIISDRSDVGRSGVVRVVDRGIDDGYPYQVEVGGDRLYLRWFPESSLEAAAPAPASESIEDDSPDAFVDELPAQVKPSVYVAAHFPDASQADRVAGILNRAGHLVVSTWHSGEPDATPEAAALRDFGQIDDADALVLLSTPHRTTGGKFVELGFALGRNKRVFVLGTRENWMLYHPSVKVFATVEELITSGAL